MVLLAAAVIVALCGAAAADAGEDDACTGKGVRPVLVVPGFISSPLYDSSNDFQRVFPILESEPPELFGLLELAQQFEGLTQASSPVGPESGPNDTLPELTGLAGDFILRGVFGDLMSLVDTWEHPIDPDLRMFYSVAWDWRRDLYEQAQRVADKVRQVREETSCKPIVAGHSFGSRLIHTALAREDLELSGDVAGVMYFVGQFLGTTWLGPSAPVFFRPGTGDFQEQRIRRTWGSGFTAVPTEPQPVCANAEELLSEMTDECEPTETQVGISCPSAECGRPADWPEEQPFFLPLNLTDPQTWLDVGLGVQQFRVANGGPPETTPEEAAFLEVGLQLAQRMNGLVVGPGVPALQERHPPATLVSLALGAVPDEASFLPIPPSFTPTHLECEPNTTFAQEGAGPWCVNLTIAGPTLGDSLLPITVQELPGPGWDGVISTYRVTEYPLDRWDNDTIAIATNMSEPAFEFSFTAHQLAVQQRVSKEGALECVDVMPAAQGELPSLEQMLCEVVARADGEPWGGAAAGPAAGPAVGPASVEGGGDPDAAAGAAARWVAALLAVAACALA